MISWKYSFEKISKDLELAKKKKHTLDDLFNTGKISQSTYDSLDTELSKAIVETEAHQKELASQMSSKIAELEEQISTLEVLLASSELQYAAGEIDDELHTHESTAFSVGLEATKQELNTIKNIVASVMQESVQPPEPQLEAPEITEAEVPKTEEVVAESPETTVEAPVEENAVEVTTESQPEESIQTPVEEPAETTTEVIAEAQNENLPEASAETPAEIPTSDVEAPVEISEEENVPNEEVTIEVIKEVKEEQVMSPESVTEDLVDEAPTPEGIVEEALTPEVSEASSEEANFFRDQEETSEEKEQKEKENSDE